MAYYFDKNTDTKSEEKTVHVVIKNNVYAFITDNNVFSKKGLDFGTRTMLESIDLESLQGDILDFGCGYGPVGIYIKSNTNCNVDMIDINKRAISLALKNAKLNSVDVNIFESDIYSNVVKKYDYIITNPPIRVGKEILYKILVGAKDHLKENGSLIFVINKNQGAKSTMEYLKNYYNVNILGKNKGFYVFKCENH